MVITGAVISLPLSTWLVQGTRVSAATGSVMVYLLQGVVLALLIGALRRRLGERVLAAAPWGGADPFLGVLAGLLTGGASLLILFSLLNPVHPFSTQWDPALMSGGEALPPSSMSFAVRSGA